MSVHLLATILHPTVWQHHHGVEDVRKACVASIAALQCDYLDCYLIPSYALRYIFLPEGAASAKLGGFVTKSTSHLFTFLFR